MSTKKLVTPRRLTRLQDLGLAGGGMVELIKDEDITNRKLRHHLWPKKPQTVQHSMFSWIVLLRWGLIDSAKGSFSKNSLCRVGTSPQSKPPALADATILPSNHAKPTRICLQKLVWIHYLQIPTRHHWNNETQGLQFRGFIFSFAFPTHSSLKINCVNCELLSGKFLGTKNGKHHTFGQYLLASVILSSFVWRGINKCSSDSPWFSLVFSVNLSVGPWIINGNLLKGPPNSLGFLFFKVEAAAKWWYLWCLMFGVCFGQLCCG